MTISRCLDFIWADAKPRLPDDFGRGILEPEHMFWPRDSHIIEILSERRPVLNRQFSKPPGQRPRNEIGNCRAGGKSLRQAALGGRKLRQQPCNIGGAAAIHNEHAIYPL